jgi:hypothetical protein
MNEHDEPLQLPNDRSDRPIEGSSPAVLALTLSETRGQLAETMREIQDRLTPDAIRARVREILWERRVGIIAGAALLTAAIALVVTVKKGQNR